MDTDNTIYAVQWPTVIQRFALERHWSQQEVRPRANKESTCRDCASFPRPVTCRSKTIGRNITTAIQLLIKMASRAPAARWKAPQFSFNSPQQTQEWKNFYTRVLDYLETLDIDPEAQDDARHGWKQIKMMFQGEDRQALQSLIDNNTITPVDQKTPKHALKAIQSCIKEEDHFWHFRDEVMSDFRQQLEEQIHALNTRITTLVNKCAFQDQQTKDTIKLMLLQHAVKYHKARDWIRLQDQTLLTYTSLL